MEVVPGLCPDPNTLLHFWTWPAADTDLRLLTRAYGTVSAIPKPSRRLLFMVMLCENALTLPLPFAPVLTDMSQNSISVRRSLWLK